MDSSRKTIIIVDDDMTCLEIGRKLLKGFYRVYPAPSGLKLFEILENVTPDLILLDIDMPDMNGYEVIRKLKAGSRFADIPVVFLTAKSDEESEMTGFDLGAVEFVSKPFSGPVLLKRISHQLNISNLITTMQRLSIEDQVTSIANRRCFDIRLEAEWGRALRAGTPIGVLMIDVDSFKAYNDRYGHQQGDVVLKTVAQILQKIPTRSTDLVARYGGEEFAVLLPHTEEANVWEIAEHMRREVAKAVLECADGSPTGVTVSIGVHVLTPTLADTCATVVARADKALYAAKEAGKNRVCLYCGP